MIKVSVKLGNDLSMNGLRIFDMDIEENMCVTDFLKMLAADVGSKIMDPVCLVVLNGTKLTEKEKTERILLHNDHISIFNACVGG